MSSNRTNAAEKDLEKFIKFLALKSTQVVVQSRLGEKLQTQCCPLATGNDWFNIVIQDHPDVYAETKKALNLVQGQSILNRLPLCVEISLKTSEGDQMILEVWSLILQQPPQRQPDAVNGTVPHSNVTQKPTPASEQTLKAAHAIYNRMGVLLKSLISLTRATPAYKLSRRQCPDSYGIYYRIYVDKPQVHALGDGYKSVRIGQLNTIVGSLIMGVSYRTKMTISPSASDNTIMLKSDHFLRDLSPKHNRYHHVKKSAEKKIIDIDKPLRPGAFVDPTKIRQYTEEDFILPETPPFDWLIKRARKESGCNDDDSTGKSSSVESLRKSTSPTSPLGNGHQHNINNNTQNAVNNNNNVAFKNLELNDENKCANLTTATTTTTTATTKCASGSIVTSPIKSLLVPAISPATSDDYKSRRATAAALQSSDDDNLLKELNFPFASSTSHVNDLAKFYRDCYHAPPLLGLGICQAEDRSTTATGTETHNATTTKTTTGEINPSDQIDELSKQLEQFETSLEDYDKLVSQFGLSTSARSVNSLQAN